MRLRSRRHQGLVFEGLSKDDKRRLDAYLSEIGPTPGMEGLVPTDPPGAPDPMPEKPKRGRRA